MELSKELQVSFGELDVIFLGVNRCNYFVMHLCGLKSVRMGFLKQIYGRRDKFISQEKGSHIHLAILYFLRLRGRLCLVTRLNRFD